MLASSSSCKREGLTAQRKNLSLVPHDPCIDNPARAVHPPNPSMRKPSPDPKHKNFHYRRARVKDAGDEPLVSLLSRAVTMHPRIKTRKEKMNTEGDAFRFLLRWSRPDTFAAPALCGIMSAVSFDATAPGVAWDENQEGMEIEEVVANLRGERKGQFLKGLIYFVVVENHVVISQSQEQRIPALQDHFNYLIQLLPKTSETAKAVTVELHNIPPRDVLKKVRRVKEVVFHSHLEVSNHHAGGQQWDFLRALAGPFGLRNDFRLPDDVDSSNFLSEFRIKWRGRQRPDATPLLANLANLLADAEGIQYTVILDDDSKIVPDNLSLVGGAKVPFRASGVADESHLWAAMFKWLQTLQQQRMLPV